MKFVFDLDCTITKEEIIPLIAKEIGLYDKVQSLTKKAMDGKEPFDENFKKRIDIIKCVPLNVIHNIVQNVKLNENIAKFIKQNNKDCIIITGNLDLIITPLLKKLNMENSCFSCKGTQKNGYIQSLTNIINKKHIVQNFDFDFVAIGDGANDVDMIKMAKIGIAFGGSTTPPNIVLHNAHYVFYDDKKLYNFLNVLKQQNNM